MRAPRLPAALALVAAATFLASAAAGGAQPAGPAGTITGRVEVRLPPSTVGTQAEVGSLAGRGQRPPADRRRSVVYLETAPRGAFEEPRGRRARIDQRNETFMPRVLAITVGTTVDFPNSDTTYHNVFSLSPPRTFDLGRYAAGRSKAVTFDRPGLVRVFCDIHSHMSAFILVFSHRYFALTDAQGDYAITDVPPGTYTVSVWNEAAKVESRPVTVPAGGGDVELNFTLPQGAR